MKIEFHPQTRGKVVIFHTLSPTPSEKKPSQVELKVIQQQWNWFPERWDGQAIGAAASLWEYVGDASGLFFLLRYIK